MIYSHIYLFLLFIFTSILNIILTTHLYPIMAIGVIYYIFSVLLHQKEYYKLCWSICSFLIFEINFGFPIFSIVLLSYFIHTIVVPYLSINLSINKSNYLFTILIFYIVFIIFMTLFYSLTQDLLSQLLINYFIDIIILMVIL